mgnify:CR=1 FL=1
MRVTAASLTTVAPNDSFFDVDTVLTGEPRPMREPGIPVSDPVPPDPTTGLPDCCIPIWDENPERLSVDTNGRAGSTGETLTSNVTLTNVTGPLDYSFSIYKIQATSTPTFVSGALVREMTSALAGARAGSGSIVLVCGEAGIGKTALTDEFRRRARRSLIRWRGTASPASFRRSCPQRASPTSA